MDRLESMSMLVAVADAGSLSAAGRAMKVPLATVSRKITDLETALGTRLLIRTTRKLTLTDAGLAYVAAARSILEQVEEAERNATGEFIAPKGELVVTAPLMFGRVHVLPVVTAFLAMFPEIDIRLVLADRNVDLIDDRVDTAVRIGHLPDSAMVATQVGMMRTVTCGSPKLLALQGTPEMPAALQKYPCIAVDALHHSPTWRFQEPGSGAALELAIRPRLTVSTPEAAAQAAVAEVGVAQVMHYQAIEALQRGELQVILKSHEPSPVPVHLVHASRGILPLKTRRFIDFAAPRLREALLRISGVHL